MDSGLTTLAEPTLATPEALEVSGFDADSIHDINPNYWGREIDPTYWGLPEFHLNELVPAIPEGDLNQEQFEGLGRVMQIRRTIIDRLHTIPQLNGRRLRAEAEVLECRHILAQDDDPAVEKRPLLPHQRVDLTGRICEKEATAAHCAAMIEHHKLEIVIHLKALQE